MASKATGLTRLLNATGYSWSGFKAAWRHEAAFRQEIILALLLLPAAFWLGRNPFEYVILIAPLFLVLITELLNSGLEAVVDRIGSEYHELSGRAKDLGSAAVFTALVLVGVCWGGIFAARFLP
ncbi:MAG: diacylglycerol kinase [Gammaproteobacteria bacterium]|nr:diacylglycerol kinase [Gammaproteobacteria bacterium]